MNLLRIGLQKKRINYESAPTALIFGQYAIVRWNGSNPLKDELNCAFGLPPLSKLRCFFSASSFQLRASESLPVFPLFIIYNFYLDVQRWFNRNYSCHLDLKGLVLPSYKVVYLGAGIHTVNRVRAFWTYCRFHSATPHISAFLGFKHLPFAVSKI